MDPILRQAGAGAAEKNQSQGHKQLRKSAQFRADGGETRTFRPNKAAHCVIHGRQSGPVGVEASGTASYPPHSEHADGSGKPLGSLASKLTSKHF